MAISVRSYTAAAILASVIWQSHNPAMATDSTAGLSAEEAQRVVCKIRSHPDALVDLNGLPEFRSVHCNRDTDRKSASTSVPAQNAPHVTATKGSAHDATQTATSLAGGDKTTAFTPTYFLRNDWADLGLLGAGCLGPLDAVPANKAKGATLSFTRDYASNNKIWAAQGMAGAVFSECTTFTPLPGGGDSGFVEKSIGVYAQINSDYNSNAQFAKKNNIDTRTVGLSGEAAYLYNGDLNVLRLTPNVVFDNIKNTTAGAVMVQYIPAWISREYIWHAEGAPGDLNWFNFQFDPTFDLQFASAMERSPPLQFSGKDQSLRLGPELTFVIKPLFGPDYFSRIGITETFHPWYEAYTGRGSYWWANSIFYDFDDAGNFAVAFSYNRGEDENSGTMTNQYIASLTGKY